MSRFNQAAVNPRRTTNEEGAVAYSGLDPEQQLYAVTACNILTDGFYKSSDQTIQTILDLIPKCDPVFVGQLAVYLRKEMYLRSTPLVLLIGLALNRRLTSDMVYNVISRADELKELLGAWQSLSGNTNLKKIPNALKRGIAKAFNKFDGYHFRKYNKQGKEGITFKDAVYITHPKPVTEEKSSIFKKILDGTLDPITTWETEISLVGSDPELKKQRWESLLYNGKLPYMAALRNVRNMLQAGINEESIQRLLALLGEEKHILKSKQFPFRWYSAFHELDMCHDNNVILNLNRFTDVFEKALTISIENIPGIDKLKNESTLIACDVSGSMDHPISTKSSLTYMDIGILMGRMLSKKCGRVITGVFGNEWAPFNFGASIIGRVELPQVGLSTLGYKVLNWLTTSKLDVDNVMFFSDSQIYDDLNISSSNTSSFRQKQGNTNRSEFEKAWNKYKADHPKSRIYMFDLATYNTTPIDLMSPSVYMVSGWSEKIFQILGSIGEWKSFKNHILSYNKREVETE